MWSEKYAISNAEFFAIELLRSLGLSTDRVQGMNIEIVARELPTITVKYMLLDEDINALLLATEQHKFEVVKK